MLKAFSEVKRVPLKTVAEEQIKHLQILDENGKIDSKLMPKLSKETMVEMYKTMVASRVFDNKAFSLQRQGRLGTYAQILGQEASDVGSSFALGENDWLVPTYRNVAALIAAGMEMKAILQYWGGDERGHALPTKHSILPISIPIGTQILHAMGIAWAIQKKREKAGVIVHFGDGATSTGDFHEAMNFAGVFNVPCVFLCENNEWAISVPRKIQTAAKTLAQKAIAYGFEGIQVDGNDVFAVYKATKDALEKGYSGKGPTMIECLTYRMGHHTTSDDATKYRDPKDLEVWAKKDPIARLEKYLLNENVISKKDVEQTAKWAEEEVGKAVKGYEETPKPKATDMFDYLFEKRTKILDEQRELMEKYLEEEGEPEGH